MTRYVVRRLLFAVPLLLAVSVLCFALLQLAPGGPLSDLGPHMRVTDRQRLMETLGLDRPLHVQYGEWLWNLLHGDMGTSLVTGQPVGSMIVARLPATLELMGVSLLLSLLFGLAIGASGAVRHGSRWDHLLTVVSLIGVSVPVFWLGVLSILLFSAHLGWLPAGGRGTLGAPPNVLDHFRHLILPATVLAIVQAPLWSRHLRSSLLEVLNQDWLRAARARGLGERRVLWRHALRPAIVPIVTLLGLQAPSLFTGAAITETIFAWPGIGRLFYEGAQRFDYFRLMGILMIGAVLVIVFNLAADIACAFLDPRIPSRERR